MSKFFAFGAALLAFACALPSFAQDDASKCPEGFVQLFNGKDLTGWKPCKRDFHPYPLIEMTDAERADFYAKHQAEFEKCWTIENGELVNDGNGPYASTEKFYKDFELRLEYKTVAKADSGIYLRGNPQVQIWDTTEAGGKWNLGADKGSGALWNNQKNARMPLAYADKPFGEWNTVRITMKDDVVNVWLNGVQTVKDTVMEYTWDRSKPVPPTGPIQLQTHGGEIRWRNIFIKEL
ncbi:MAG: DUF1080 domain-containing protein [Thermoguttaceae bacterium]|nr:DUF1080 domain-containing protein [Thermoguttaceae bacterium]